MSVKPGVATTKTVSQVKVLAMSVQQHRVQHLHYLMEDRCKLMDWLLAATLIL